MSRDAQDADLAFLIHDTGDDVAVAVKDVSPGEVSAAYLKSGERLTVLVADAIPLGHKVALRQFAAGETVTEYEVTVGLTRCPIAAGEHVHTHNIRSARWQNSA